MTRRWLALALLALPGTVHAQSAVSLQPPQFELGLRNHNTLNRSFDTRTFEEWIQLRLRGTVADPRILRFELGIAPRLSQRRTSGAVEAGGNNNRWLGLDLRMALLPHRPFSATARLSRLTLDQSLLGTLDGELTTRTMAADLGARWDNRLMPLQLRYLGETWGDRSADPSGVSGTPTTIQTLQLSGGNRKTRFDLQQNTSRNGVERRTRIADFENRQTWGKGSSLLVGMSWLNQASPLEPTRSNLNLRGTLHLQHLRTVWSDWSVFRQSASTEQQDARVYTLTGNLGWQAWRNLSLGVAGLYSSGRFLESTERQLRLGPNAGLRLALPMGASVALSGSVSRQTYAGTFAEGTRLFITGERVTLDAAGVGTLANQNVDPGSIVIRSTDAGQYLPGVDYDVLEAGDITRIVAVPGGRLSPGQVVLADYQYAPLAMPDAAALWADYSGELRVRWFTLYHHRWLVDPDVVTATPLGTRTEDHDHQTTGFRVVIPSSRITVTADAQRQYRRDNGFAITANTVGGGVRSRLMPGLNVGLGADYLFTEGSTGTITQVGGHGQVDWMPHPTLTFAAIVGGWRARENDVTRRTRLDTSLRARWQRGLLQASLLYGYRDWQNTQLTTGFATGTPTHLVTVEIRRRF